MDVVKGRAPRRTQQQRRDHTRAALIEATVACLVEHGYAGTTTQRVQDRAGVSRGALLHHFASKADLFVAAIGHVAEAQAAHVRARAAELTARPGGAASDGLDVLREVMCGPLFLAGLELWLAARTDPALRAALLPAERRVGRALRELAPAVLGSAGDRVSHEGLLALFRGLAMTSVLRTDPALEREILLRWAERPS
ncbi:TetR/AcrR family transcriptional regulator [Pseudonocardia nigra]|uniref:TetR/AcrR family transcriptional regulator n=1 Tax=Pseudonocardia nigra TaxID=1921578 RepID=UPI001C5E777E|nr:TetR/AcrR family transcriptional regulator [Pseudonocardia nigra]